MQKSTTLPGAAAKVVDAGTYAAAMFRVAATTLATPHALVWAARRQRAHQGELAPG